MRTAAKTAAAAAVAAVGLSQAPLVAAISPLSDWSDGISTYYGGAPDGMSPYQPSFGTLNGACGYGLLDKNQYPFWSVGALDSSNKFVAAGPLKACGQCFEIQCMPGQAPCNSDPNQRTVAIMNTDSCDTCSSPDHIDLQALTYLKIAPWSSGRINMRYRRIQCSPPQPIDVDIMDASGSGAWLRLSISSVAQTGSVQAVYVRSSNSGSGWQPLTNKWGAVWEMDTAPQYPLDFRFVDPSGQDITAYSVLKSATSLATDLSTSVQFSLGGGGAAASAASAAASAGQPLVTAFEGPPQASAGAQASSALGLPLPQEDQSASSPGSSSGGSPPSPPPPSPPPGAYSPPSPPPGAYSPPSPPPGAYSPPSPPPPPPPGAPGCQQQVTAYGSVGGSSPPCSTGGASPPSPQQSAPACPCADTAPDSTYTCAQQSTFGKCSESWMTAASSQAPHGFCAVTCGRCSAC